MKPETWNPKPPPETASLALLSTEPATARWPFFRAVAELTAHVAEGLQHAHDQGVVHRDIKPSNLMLDGQGKVWITDFGLARVEANPSLTQSGDLLGTLRYMSPEQSRGSQAAIDARSDLYSLGATLYEVLTLLPLFGDFDRSSLLKQVAEAEPTRPRKVNPQIPPDLETIVLKLIEKEPARRYASAGDLALDLRRFIDNKPIAARPPTLSHRLAKWSARNRSLVVAAAICILLIALFGGGIFGWWTRDSIAKQQTAEAIATSALGSAGAARQDNHWPLALAEYQRAEAALAAVTSSSELYRQVASAKRDAQMAIRLEQIRLQAAMLAGSNFDFVTADAAYDSAFTDFGIPITTLSLDDAVEQIRHSAIRNELAAALTDWSIVRKRMPDPPRPDWRHFLSLARQADPDPWRGQLRKAWTKNELLELAEAPALWKQSPSTLFLFVTAATHQRLNDNTLQKVVRDLQRLHPEDFWLNFAAAGYFDNTEPPQRNEVVRFYSAAASLRPDAAAVHNNLGVAFHRLGRRDDAIAEYQRAIALSPDAYFPHANLGVALAEDKRFDAALAEFHAAHKHGAKSSQLRTILATLADSSEKFASLLDELR